MSSDLDFKLVKAAGAKTTYTAKQIKEMARCTTDPLYFMENYMWIQHPTKGKMKFEAYDYQKRLITAYHTNISTVALLPRQSGKCVINKTIVTVKQNSTGEIYDIPIGTYYEWAAAMRDGTQCPDISKFRRQT